MPTLYQARNVITGQTFLPRLFMTHAMQDYIDQPILSNWTVDLIETPEPSKSFESVFPDATESPRETISEEDRLGMMSDHFEDEHRQNMVRVFTEQSAEFECPN